jgi:uncharacterized protein YdhG (YjbR/CyaY superfamily)
MKREKQTFETVAEYIDLFPPDVQKILKKIRSTIRKASPKAVESISYQIAAYKLDGKVLIYFAGFSKHVSVYPAPRNASEFAEELAAYKGGKGTVQFPLDKPIPYELIERIVKFRAAEIG